METKEWKDMSGKEKAQGCLSALVVLFLLGFIGSIFGTNDAPDTDRPESTTASQTPQGTDDLDDVPLIFTEEMLQKLSQKEQGNFVLCTVRAGTECQKLLGLEFNQTSPQWDKCVRVHQNICYAALLAQREGEQP